MDYKYKGAEALIRLHEENLLSFIEVWKTVKKANIKLHKTNDDDYQSLEHLLFHVIRSSKGYILWICEKLNLPDPQINIHPMVDVIENSIDKYVKHLLDRWKLPLAKVDEHIYFDQTYKSNWGTDYCIEAMLEHAVMHPIRHKFQLQQLLKNC